LASYRVRRAVEEHLHLEIVTLSRILRHPTPGLEVEILEVIAGSAPTGLFVEHFGVLTDFATMVDARQILEEQPRAVEEHQQRTVSVLRQRVKAGFNIGEVRAKESRHIAVKSSPV
jgi:hypothetical protein